ncbi:MAG: 2-C-methyl-D-erythritol 2,4-cyclodiphosphate synthase [Thermotogota bacterium]|nr:2-C-methyl-D-erythritol 2,4-cyclodiphosphate synthase [Thermotogota bacterium]
MMLDEELYRIGFGWDVHRIEKEKGSLYVGGIKVSDDFRAIAHSDGDALIHSLIDAILGALSKGNIGVMFPADEKNRGRRSTELLKEAIDVLKNSSFRVVNIDSTVIIKEVNLGDQINEMVALLSNKLDIDKRRISIKPKSGNGIYERVLMAYSTLLLERRG